MTIDVAKLIRAMEIAAIGMDQSISLVEGNTTLELNETAKIAVQDDECEDDAPDEIWNVDPVIIEITNVGVFAETPMLCVKMGNEKLFVEASGHVLFAITYV